MSRRPLRIAVVGGGPAGLYFSLLMKKANASHDIAVFERNPPDATYGWGVVFSEETLGSLRDADFETYAQITDTFAKWNAIDVRYGGETIRSRGHVFSAIARTRLLGILQERCRALGVALRFREEVNDLAEFEDFDLIVAGDGVNSRIRAQGEDVYKPDLSVHQTKFAWFGTDFAFKAFTFIFRDTPHGLFQVHAYPFDASTSTFIVECHQSTWRRAGLDAAGEEESIAFCEKLFAEDLGGHRLLSNKSVWISFITVRCESWRRGNVVLLGDAAHTAHFTIGSGTKLAMEDSLALAGSLQRHEKLEGALADYELERQPVVERLQEAARESSAYFENVRRYRNFEPMQFAFNLLTRSGRITYVNLAWRDPQFVNAVDRWFAQSPPRRARAGDDLVVAPPPMFAPVELRGVRIANRVALAPVVADAAEDGVPSAMTRRQLVSATGSGAGLVLTDMAAVAPEGRISPRSAAIHRPEHVKEWGRIVALAHANGAAKIALQLGHAGRRGSTRPRSEGVDRPLRHGNWPLLSASALPYAPWSQVPKEMDRRDMDRVREGFVSAARGAVEAGFDVLELNYAHGYLLASFISPLTNRRGDSYGGAIGARMRFPLEVFDAVRAVWPEDAPLSVAVSATDWAEGGLEADDAVAVARMLKAHGCDLLRVVAGQTVAETRPVYGRFFQVPFSDFLRNEAGIETMTSGNITTADEVNTIVTAGRADLCIIDADRYAALTASLRRTT